MCNEYVERWLKHNCIEKNVWALDEFGGGDEGFRIYPSRSSMKKSTKTRFQCTFSRSFFIIFTLFFRSVFLFKSSDKNWKFHDSVLLFQMFANHILEFETQTRDCNNHNDMLNRNQKEKLLQKIHVSLQLEILPLFSPLIFQVISAILMDQRRWRNNNREIFI